MPFLLRARPGMARGFDQLGPRLCAQPDPPCLAAAARRRVESHDSRVAGAHGRDLAHEEERWWRDSHRGSGGHSLEMPCRGRGNPDRSGGATSAGGQTAFDPAGAGPGQGRFCAAWTLRTLSRYSNSCERPAGDGRLRLPRPLDVRRSFDWVRIGAIGVQAPAAWRVPRLHVPGTHPVPGGGVVRLEVARKNATLRAAELSLRRLPAGLELRGWQPGDQYRLRRANGLAGKKSRKCSRWPEYPPGSGATGRL